MHRNYTVRALHWGSLLAIALLLGACAGNSQRVHQAARGAPIHDTVRLPPQVAAEANNVLFHAINLIGTPYQWGGDSPADGFDCSGLVDYVYRRAVNLDLPRTSRAMAQLNAPRITRINRLASGDLLFFRTDGRRIGHVAIYVGNGRFVHAPNSRSPVQLGYITNPYWNQHFAFARRVLEER